jgi:type IV secretory pathway TraG/TraD family ATPase VirD4
VRADAPRRLDAADVATWALLGVLALGPVALWAAAHLAAFATGRWSAEVGLDDVARAIPALAGEPSDPAAAMPGSDLPGPVAYWMAVAAVVAAALAALVLVAMRLGRRRARPGMAARRELRGLTAKAVADHANVLRPDLVPGAPADERVAAAGVGMGRHHPSGMALFGTIEDSVAVLAPPRSGKTLRVLVPAVLDHDGPAVVTSTRWDVVRLTATSRLQRGPVWVFDADQTSNVALPAGAVAAAWSPVDGAEDPQTAMVRARSLARASGAGHGVTNADFFADHAQTVLQCYLHAAALRGLSIARVRNWSLDPTDSEPVDALRASPVAPGWGAELSRRAGVADRQRDGVWGVVQQALGALAEPRLLQRCCPAPGTGLDPDDLLTAGGTLYVVGRAETQAVVAPLVAALVEAITDTARRTAATRPSGRLAPSLLVALDEVAGIAPLPTLPTLLADGGGSGITTIIVLQSRSQARARWGEDTADAILAACTLRLVLGGGGELRELEDLSRLVGERDDSVQSHTWQPWSANTAGSSTSTALRRLPVVTPAELQALPKGRGVLCSPSARPAEVYMPAWWERRDAEALRRHAETAHHQPVGPKPAVAASAESAVDSDAPPQ